MKGIISQNMYLDNQLKMMEIKSSENGWNDGSESNIDLLNDYSYQNQDETIMNFNGNDNLS